MQMMTVEIWTEDINRLSHFYSDELELPRIENPDRSSVKIQAGKSRLVLHQADGTASGHYHLAFDVPENQFELAYKWLTQRVSPATSTSGQMLFHFDKWNSDSVYFKDPDGNILELIARHNQPNATRTEFSGHSIVAVSEFGIPTDEVPKSAERLCQALPATPYDGAGSEEFTAVGDELGLLIVVKEGRIWMPGTGKAAVFVPFCLEILNEQGNLHKIKAPKYPFEIISV